MFVLIIAVVWVIVAITLWVVFKVTHTDVGYIPGGPPQQSLLGSFMWPFYLCGFVFDWTLRVLRIRQPE